MPFTFSHPAVVLPFYRIKGVSLTGLVAGSLAPDFEYFIRMTDKRVYTHTWTGLLKFDVPLALLLAFIFHHLIRNQLIIHLPSFLQKRFKRFESFNWTSHFKKHWLSILICTLAGAVSHLTWDGFTHENGFFILSFPQLATTLPLGPFEVEIHMILQVVSTLLGGLYTLYFIWQLPKDNSVSVSEKPFAFWLFIIGLSLLIFLIRLSLIQSYEIEDFIIPAISAFLFSTLITSALKKYNLFFR